MPPWAPRTSGRVCATARTNFVHNTLYHCTQSGDRRRRVPTPTPAENHLKLEGQKARRTAAETERSRSQIATLKSGRGQNIKYRPYAFTEHSAIPAANVLNSARAIAMGVYVVRAFVQLTVG